MRKNPWYDSNNFHTIELPFDYEPYEKQKSIIDDIMDNYNNNREGYNIGGGNGGRAGGRDVLRRSREY